MTALVDKCPSCHAAMAGQVKFHCDGRSTPCGWVKHECDGRARAVIDPRLGRYYLETVVKS